MEKAFKEDCLFCKFAKGEIEVAKALENEFVLAFVDINPAGPLMGHTLVLPKKHFTTVDEMDEKYITQVMLAIKRLVPAIKEISGAEGINIIQNNGKAAGQAIMHVHFHIIPRKIGDGIKIDENRRKAAPMEQTEVAESIKEALK